MFSPRDLLVDFIGFFATVCSPPGGIVGLCPIHSCRGSNRIMTLCPEHPNQDVPPKKRKATNTHAREAPPSLLRSVSGAGKGSIKKS